MIAFGGNGPLHATRVARRARVSRILVPNSPGVGSAVGFLYAPVSFEVVRSLHMRLERLDLSSVNALLTEMSNEAAQVVRAGAPEAALTTSRSAFMRYHGQGHEIAIALPEGALSQADLPALKAAFEAEYATQFSRPVPGMSIEILNWAVSVSAPAPPLALAADGAQAHSAIPAEHRRILCDVTGTWVSAGLYTRETLAPGAILNGPALIVEPQTTTLVSADFAARVDAQGNLWLEAQA